MAAAAAADSVAVNATATAAAGQKNPCCAPPMRACHKPVGVEGATTACHPSARERSAASAPSCPIDNSGRGHETAAATDAAPRCDRPRQCAKKQHRRPCQWRTTAVLPQRPSTATTPGACHPLNRLPPAPFLPLEGKKNTLTGYNHSHNPPIDASTSAPPRPRPPPFPRHSRRHSQPLNGPMRLLNIMDATTAVTTDATPISSGCHSLTGVSSSMAVGTVGTGATGHGLQLPVHVV